MASAGNMAHLTVLEGLADTGMATAVVEDDLASVMAHETDSRMAHSRHGDHDDLLGDRRMARRGRTFRPLGHDGFPCLVSVSIGGRNRARALMAASREGFHRCHVDFDQFEVSVSADVDHVRALRDVVPDPSLAGRCPPRPESLADDSDVRRARSDGPAEVVVTSNVRAGDLQVSAGGCDGAQRLLLVSRPCLLVFAYDHSDVRPSILILGASESVWCRAVRRRSLPQLQALPISHLPQLFPAYQSRVRAWVKLGRLGFCYLCDDVAFGAEARVSEND